MSELFSWHNTIAITPISTGDDELVSKRYRDEPEMRVPTSTLVQRHSTIGMKQHNAPNSPQLFMVIHVPSWSQL